MPGIHLCSSLTEGFIISASPGITNAAQLKLMKGSCWYLRHADSPSVCFFRVMDCATWVFFNWSCVCVFINCLFFPLFLNEFSSFESRAHVHSKIVTGFLKLFCMGFLLPRFTEKDYSTRFRTRCHTSSWQSCCGSAGSFIFLLARCSLFCWLILGG